MASLVGGIIKTYIAAAAITTIAIGGFIAWSISSLRSAPHRDAGLVIGTTEVGGKPYTHPRDVSTLTHFKRAPRKATHF